MWPDGKKFAFTIFDDTDLCSIEKVEPVYRLLGELGIFTTKSVWPLSAAPGEYCGATLEEAPYAQFIQRLQEQGFEIGLHNVRHGHSPRATTERGLQLFYETLGKHPRVHANHGDNHENLYWGPARFESGALRRACRVGRKRQDSSGHVESSPYFWGDLSKQHISYVRNLVFNEINVLRVNPTLPYAQPDKPYVNYWFSSSLAYDVTTFCRLLNEANQDKLEREQGACIIYTHLAYGFSKDGVVDREFERLMRRLNAKNGWFVPVSTVLDHLRTTHNGSGIKRAELVSMDWRWLASRIRCGDA